jgi:hypothetical protein
MNQLMERGESEDDQVIVAGSLTSVVTRIGLLALCVLKFMLLKNESEMVEY